MNYFEQKLRNADKTEFDYNGVIVSNTCLDGHPILHDSHFFRDSDASCYSNFVHSEHAVQNALVTFYNNCLMAGEDTTANTIICKRDLSELAKSLGLMVIEWEHDPWFVFNRHKGISDRWWHICGYIRTHG